MHKFIACLVLLSVGACASDEPSRRHPTTARAGVDPAHRSDHHNRVAADIDTDLDGKRRSDAPVIVAEQPSAVKAVPVADARDAVDRTDTRVGDRNAPSDSEVTQRIRRAVSADDELTTAAKNVKIVTEDGRVTLKGDVTNEREKASLETHARKVAGANKVDNQLVVR